MTVPLSAIVNRTDLYQKYQGRGKEALAPILDPVIHLQANLIAPRSSPASQGDSDVWLHQVFPSGMQV